MSASRRWPNGRTCGDTAASRLRRLVRADLAAEAQAWASSGPDAGFLGRPSVDKVALAAEQTLSGEWLQACGRRWAGKAARR